jgi:hypothetical protein
VPRSESAFRCFSDKLQRGVLSLDDTVTETPLGIVWAVAAKSLHPTDCHDKAPFVARDRSGKCGELHRTHRIGFEGEASKQKARLKGGPKTRQELEIQIAVKETSLIGARIFAGAQKTLLSTNTQLVLPCWVSSTAGSVFPVVTRALSQAIMAKQHNAAAMNSLLRVVVMICVPSECFTLGLLYGGRAAARQELLRVADV